VVAGLPICVTDDEPGVRELARRALVIYSQLPSYRAMLDREGAREAADVAIIGSEAQVKQQLAAVAEAGATDFAALEFTRTDDERARTREVLRSLL
jgi:alkanesulfonate monooxygenase SsuD/methylene tetrahydromethanopterin reductase-like flavin-dependent oxidoreductase (luciferase family)